MNAPYADLGSKVGFIYGGLSVLGFVFAFFFLPEVKNRSLEEIDSMFHSGIGLRHFKNYRSPAADAGKKVTELETLPTRQTGDYGKDGTFVEER